VFLRHAQCGNYRFWFADDTSDQARLKREHLGPGDRHAAGAAFGVIVSKTSEPGIAKRADLRLRQVFHGIGCSSTRSTQ
jgi:hypothetical protein